jgi:hypothetical protein
MAARARIPARDQSCGLQQRSYPAHSALQVRAPGVAWRPLHT